MTKVLDSRILRSSRSSRPDVSLHANNLCCSIRSRKLKYFDSSGTFIAVTTSWMPNYENQHFEIVFGSDWRCVPCIHPARTCPANDATLKASPTALIGSISERN